MAAQHHTSQTIDTPNLFRRAHAEARSGARPRMSYRDRFRSALRRAWRDAQFQLAIARTA